MFKLKILPLVICLMVLLLGCEKILIRPIANTNTEIFNYVWQRTNDSYCCFDIKGINWDSVYQNYAPMIDDDMEEEAFMNILHGMLSELEDGMLSLHKGPDTLRYEEYYLPYPRNFDKNTIENFYKSSDDSYALFGDVAYINDFLYDECDNDLDQIRALTGKLVIDLRNISTELNSGYKFIKETDGDALPSIESYKSIASKVVGEDTLSLGTRHYNAKFPDIGGGWLTKIYPCPEPVIFDEVVVLCNRQTFYEGNMLAYVLTKIPNCTIIGDRTGGGSERIEKNLLPNSWTLQVPAGYFFDRVNDVYVSEGFDPDVFVEDDPNTTDIDEIIEKALELLN